MFSLFGKKEKAPTFQDLIWMSEKARQLHLITKVKQLADAGNVLVVSSFQDSLNDFEQKLKTLGLDTVEATTTNEIGEKQLQFAHGKLFRNDAPSKTKLPKLTVVFLEHYPLPDVDLQIMKSVANLADSVKIIFYLSLDGELFSSFGSNRIKPLMQQLGADENEVIEHAMISSSIKNAQKKIAKKVYSEQKTDSEADWYRINFPGGVI